MEKVESVVRRSILILSVFAGTASVSRAEEMVVRWERFETTALPALKIETPSQTVWIATEIGARVWAWEIDGRDVVKRHLDNRDPGGLCSDLFWIHRPARWTGEEKDQYVLLERRALPEAVRVTFRKVFGTTRAMDPVKGMVLEKTYTVSAKASAIEIVYRLSNPTDRPMQKLQFAPHSLPLLGKKDLEKRGTEFRDEVEILLPTPEGIKEVNAPYRNAGYADIAHHASHSRGGWMWSKERKFSKGAVAEYLPLTKEGLVYRFEFEKAQFLYFARVEPPTIELIYEPFDILPGRAWEARETLVYNRGGRDEATKYLK